MLCRLVMRGVTRKYKDPSDLLSTWQILFVLGWMAPKRERERERGVDVHEWLHPLAFWVMGLGPYALENTQTTRHSLVVGDE